MKPVKFFVEHAAVDQLGMIADRAIVTPPMEEAQASEYLEWYSNGDGSALRLTVARRLFSNYPDAEEVIRVFETTLY